ncbi:hypothetical protein [Laceyella sacchari]|uniref:Holin n=1 Tax=Laceyella sacchari TaxID=37482 RepID=A0ABY5U6R2_LACSH|nr:hypothetical protein [Laceyella sacchari]UWE05316.1 hypothetical protein NYR52_16490 [Laceyella sacchari]
MKNIVENLKNPLVWVYLLSFIKVTLGAVGVDIAPEQWAQYEDVLNALCGLLVALGIFAFNPYQRQRGEKKE